VAASNGLVHAVDMSLDVRRIASRRDERLLGITADVHLPIFLFFSAANLSLSLVS
jgi:hypothetical protein